MRITNAHLSSLAHLLKERVGFEVRPEGHSLLRLALSDRLREGFEQPDIEGYLCALREKEDELERLLPLVTVGKTEFFRDRGQFRAFTSLLPTLLDQARSEERMLSIWSAGCASGEEAYSIAISLIEAGADPSEVELLATDVNPKAIAAASAGRYRHERVESVGQEQLSRFFVETEDGYEAGPEIRDIISSFRTHNLHSQTTPLPKSGAWDIIFCRNVLIYFEKEVIRSVVHRFHQAMRPGAYLFLGYSESLFKLFDGFRLEERERAFLYTRPYPHHIQALSSLAEEPAPIESEQLAVKEKREEPDVPSRVANGASRVGPARAGAHEKPSQAPSATSPATHLKRAARLIENGSFDDATSLLQRAAAEAPSDLSLLLTLGNLHALLRQDEEAELCFRSSMEREPLSTEALLYHGMFLLDRSRLSQAESQLTRAVFLDPDFGLAHYILGRCREKLGDLEGARRSYRNALRALRVEQKPLSAFYPDLPRGADAVAEAASIALASL